MPNATTQLMTEGERLSKVCKLRHRRKEHTATWIVLLNIGRNIQLELDSSMWLLNRGEPPVLPFQRPPTICPQSAQLARVWQGR